MQGEDQKGTFYSSIKEMWQKEFNFKKSGLIQDRIGSIKNWYQRGKNFWDKSQATYDGMLNGYGPLSDIDLKGSSQFLKKYINNNPHFQTRRVLDCGAGIGRIAKEMLCGIFKKVDLIDQCQKFIEEAKVLLKNHNVEHFYAQGLQQFQFEEKYDCVWVQWVLAHLPDKDAEQFLKKAKKSLLENGIIVVKQNHTENGFLVDKDDGSVSRSTQLYKQLFEKAQLKVMMEQIQKGWPSDLQDVKMYILQ